ncbi:MAG: hypothetical protein FJ037_02940 [Chloroflexi bacterium]|nr:hypothetical protein [Chloroflexota bacterium]
MTSLPNVRKPRVSNPVSPMRTGAATVIARPGGVIRQLPEGWGVVRQRISRTMLAGLALLTVAGVGIFQVLQTSNVASTGYEVRRLEGERTDLDAEIRLLEAQLASSANLEYLRKTASERLGMTPAANRLRISVDTPAPDVVPLPRRYVPVVEEQPAPERSWWDTFVDAIPGRR